MTNNWITPDWPAPLGIKAASTLRTGGISKGDFASWNLADHVNDDADHVKINRQRLRQQLQLPSKPIWLNQIHGNRVITATNDATNTSADASYSRQAGIICTVMTADCLPLLLCSKDGLCVAAVHCGWRGLLAGIINQTCLAMKLSNDSLVWMGPAIGSQVFTVGSEVRQLFIANNAAYRPAFVGQAKGKWLADIYRIARINLAEIGITQIYGGNRCTYSENQHFFSYRKQNQTGRMATLIWREF